MADATLAQDAPALLADASRFNARKVRCELVARGIGTGHFVRYAYRPFDVRWLYWHEDTKLLDEKRPDYFAQVFAGNRALVSQQKPRREWSKPQCIAALGCLDLMDRSASYFPLWLDSSAANSLGLASSPVANLTPAAAKYLAGFHEQPDALFFHALAMLHSEAYRVDNAGALRQEWPRIPLPDSLSVLHASTELGREVAALLDTEAPVAGVTNGTLRPELMTIASTARLDGQPLAAADFALTAG